MRSRAWMVVPCLTLAVLAATIVVEAQEGQPDLPPGVTAEMMEAWQEAMAPGPEHREMAAMAGNWTFAGTFWMAPDAPPSKSTGTAVRELILDGRVLTEKVVSEMMGEPFEGFGMMGYDNVAKEYWGTWNDNMGTGIMLSTGRCEKGVCEFTGTYNDAMVGGQKTVRMTYRHQPDREVHAMYDRKPDGTEYKTMELVYTRVGAKTPASESD